MMEIVPSLCLFNSALSILCECAFAIFLFASKEVCFTGYDESQMCVENVMKTFLMSYVSVLCALGLTCNAWILGSRKSVEKMFGGWFLLRVTFLCLLFIALALWCLCGSLLFMPESTCFVAVTVFFILSVCYEVFFTVLACEFVQ